MSGVDRTRLLDALERWRTGALDAAGLQAAAAAIPVPAAGGPGGGLREALLAVDVLQVDLLVPGDAPAIGALASAEDTALGEAIAAWARYRDAIDLDGRSRALRKDPYYRPFCR